jgi:hypothetical protein
MALLPLRQALPGLRELLLEEGCKKPVSAGDGVAGSGAGRGQGCQVAVVQVCADLAECVGCQAVQGGLGGALRSLCRAGHVEDAGRRCESR